MSAEKPKEKNADEAGAAPAEAGGSRKKLLLLAAVAGVGVLAAVAAGVFFWPSPEKQQESKPRPLTVAKVLKALDAGTADEARELAEQLRTEEQARGKETGTPAFVLGMLAARDAEKRSGAARRKLLLLAAAHLEEARIRKVPPPREATALITLANALCETGEARASRYVVRDVLQLPDPPKAEAHFIAAASYLRERPAKPAEALKENDLSLSQADLSPEQFTRATLQRAEILLALDRPADARSILEDVLKVAAAPTAEAEGEKHAPAGPRALPPTAREAARIVLARALLAESRAMRKAGADRVAEANRKCQEATRVLREILGRETYNTPTTRRAMYWIGICLLESGDTRGALAQFERTLAANPSTPEAAAAQFDVAELLQSGGQYDAALAAYGKALATVTDPESYDNPLLPLETLRRRTLEAYRQYLAAGDYPRSLRLIGLMSPAFPEVEVVQMEAKTCQAWGDRLLEEAQHTPQRRVEMEKQGRAQLRQAAGAYERLARLRILTRSYPDDLWDSAEAFFRGRNYSGAVRMIAEYLKNDGRRRQSQALTRQGESLMALDRMPEALAAFDRCIQSYPREAFAARLRASQVRLEQGDVKAAERLLLDNLEGGDLTPASPEWRDSLFALGSLLHQTGRYADAASRLEEALQRYAGYTKPAESNVVRQGSAEPAASADSTTTAFAPQSLAANPPTPASPATPPAATSATVQETTLAPVLPPQALAAQYALADCHLHLARDEAKALEQEKTEPGRQARTKRIEEERTAALDSFRRAREAILQGRTAQEHGPVEKAILRNCYFAEGSLLAAAGDYEAAIAAYAAAATRFRNAPEVLEAQLQIARAYEKLDRPDEAQAWRQQARAALRQMKPDTPFLATTNHTRQEWETLLAGDEARTE
jgi:tetratricopeptide (TPR) repeat protein